MGLQLLLILASWIVSAVFPSSPIHALIGSGGLRWFIGSFAKDCYDIRKYLFHILGAVYGL